MPRGAQAMLEKQADSVWNQLYEICWNFYVKNVWDINTFKAIVDKIEKSDDKQLIRFLIWFNDARKRSNFNDKFQWMTSFLYGRRYPPLGDDLVVKEPWNDLQQLDSIIKYGNEPIDLVKMQPDFTTEERIVQNRRVNNCSLICSLTNAREENQIKSYSVHNVFNVILHFNGSNRLVSVLRDSNFPKCSKDGAALTLFSHNIEDMLIELAYFEIKNNRNYAYGGSNTATDTYLLTGWIPEILNLGDVSFSEIRKCYQFNAMLALGTDSVKGKEVTENHDFVVTSVNWKKEQFTILNPHGTENPTVYTWDDLIKEFKWLYVNWDPYSKYTQRVKLHDRYSDKFNAYPTWTQKPLMCIENKSNSIQNCHLYLERHLLDDSILESNLTIGEIPRSGFTAVSAEGNNSGFCNMQLRLNPHETRLIFYHSDKKCNLTFHLLSNSGLVSMSKCKSDILTAESSWNITNNQWTIGTSEYFKSPVFKLKSDGFDDTYLDFELVSQLPAKVNFQIFESDDYALQRPIFKNDTYSPQIFSKHGVRLLKGREYFIVCSIAHHITSPFIFTLRNPETKQSKFELSPYSLGFGGLRYNEVLRCKTRITISVSNFTRLFVLLFTSASKTNGRLTLRLYEKETEEILFEQIETRYDLSVKPFPIPNIELKPASYVLEIFYNADVVICNLGTSHRAIFESDL